MKIHVFDNALWHMFSGIQTIFFHIILKRFGFCYLRSTIDYWNRKNHPKIIRQILEKLQTIDEVILRFQKL